MEKYVKDKKECSDSVLCHRCGEVIIRGYELVQALKCSDLVLCHGCGEEIIRGDELVHALNYEIEQNEESPKHDAVENPSHYTDGEIEVIDYIKDKLTDEQFEGFCMGNVLKYTSRYRHKGGVEDLKKAKWYLERVIDSSK